MGYLRRTMLHSSTRVLFIFWRASFFLFSFFFLWKIEAGARLGAMPLCAMTPPLQTDPIARADTAHRLTILMSLARTRIEQARTGEPQRSIAQHRASCVRRIPG